MPRIYAMGIQEIYIEPPGLLKTNWLRWLQVCMYVVVKFLRFYVSLALLSYGDRVE